MNIDVTGRKAAIAIFHDHGVDLLDEEKKPLVSLNDVDILELWNGRLPTKFIGGREPPVRGEIVSELAFHAEHSQFHRDLQSALEKYGKLTPKQEQAAMRCFECGEGT